MLIAAVFYLVGGAVVAPCAWALGRLAAAWPMKWRAAAVAAMGLAPVLAPITWFAAAGLTLGLDPWADPKLPAFVLACAPFSAVALPFAWLGARRPA